MGRKTIKCSTLKNIASAHWDAAMVYVSTLTSDFGLEPGVRDVMLELCRSDEVDAPEERIGKVHNVFVCREIPHTIE